MAQWDYTAVAPAAKDYVASDAGTGAAPAHTNPAALTVGAPTPVAPAALSVVAPDHSNPTALSGVAPTPVAPAGLTGGAPAHVDPAAVTAVAPAAANPAALSGAAPTPVAPAALSAAAPGHSDFAPPTGAAPTASAAARLTLEAPRLNPNAPLTPAPIIDDNVNTQTIPLEAELALNQICGQTRIPANCNLTRVQVSLQDAPVGGPLTARLVDGAGAPYLNQGNPIDVAVPDGGIFAEVVLNVPTLLAAGSNILAKITTIGPGTPGGFGQVTLFTALAS